MYTLTGQLKIGDREFETWPIQKVLFIFFLKNNKGVETTLICDHQDELYNIYEEVRKSADVSSVINMFDKKKIGDPSFIYNKAKPNQALKRLIGKAACRLFTL